MESFISFGKDFEIMPYMIKEKNYVTYYNLLLKHQKDYNETINDLFNSIPLKNGKNLLIMAIASNLAHSLFFYTILVSCYITKNSKFNLP